MKGSAGGAPGGSIYLDFNATTPVDPRVVETMARSLAEDFGNPSSSHALGRRAREAVEAARADVARLLAAEPDEVVFTGGGTESDNLALKGLAFRRPMGHVITCQGEHPAVLETCGFLERQCFRVTRLPIDRQGLVDPGGVERAITRDTVLISVMHANNETGTIQPLAAISRVARERGIPFHTDAAQSVGKIPCRVNELGVDLLAVAGHKLYAPKGVGALYVRRGIRLEPLLHGAGHERGLRAGTEAVHQIVGLGAAARIAQEEMAKAAERMLVLRDRLHRLLEAEVPGLSLNGHPAHRLPNTLNVNFPRVSGADLLARALRVAASTGAACHGAFPPHSPRGDGSAFPPHPPRGDGAEAALSPVLAAMGVEPGAGRGAVRLSLGRSTTAEEIEEAARALVEAHRALARERALT